MDLSVVMTVYNNEKTLRLAIDSILSQTYADFIFYIVDDCSSDESPRILEEYCCKDKRIKLIINRRHLGLTKSLNKALCLVKTKYVARMDADDIALPKRLAKQINFLNNHQDIALLGTAVYLINDNGQQLGQKSFPLDNQHLRKKILQFCPFIHPTWLFRQEIVAELGGYNEDFPYAQDYELALRIAVKYPVANLAELLLYYRVAGSGSISWVKLKIQEAFAIKARWLALFKFGYPKQEFYKLIKPLLSFLVPTGIKKLVYQKLFWTGCLLLSLLILSGCQKSSAPAPSSLPNPVVYQGDYFSTTSSAVTVSRASDYKNWKHYSNDKYRYKLRYPYNWNFVDIDQQPETVTLSRQTQVEQDGQRAICRVSVLPQKVNSLDESTGVKDLRQQGRESRQLKIADQSGLFFGGLGQNGQLFSLFFQKQNQIYRMDWDINYQDFQGGFKDICLQIMASLTFF